MRSIVGALPSGGAAAVVAEGRPELREGGLDELAARIAAPLACQSERLLDLRRTRADARLFPGARTPLQLHSHAQGFAPSMAAPADGTPRPKVQAQRNARRTRRQARTSPTASATSSANASTGATNAS